MKTEDPWEIVERLQKQPEISANNFIRSTKRFRKQLENASKKDLETLQTLQKKALDKGILIITSDKDISIIKKE